MNIFFLNTLLITILQNIFLLKDVPIDGDVHLVVNAADRLSSEYLSHEYITSEYDSSEYFSPTGSTSRW